MQKIGVPNTRGAYGGFGLDSEKETTRSKEPLLLNLDAVTSKFSILHVETHRNILPMLGKL